MLLALTVTVTFLDQLTKWLICRNFGTHDHITVIPGFFDLRKVLNAGAAWGMLSGQRALLIAVSVGMLSLLWYNRAEFIKSGRLARIGIGLLTGGIIGNLIDRLKSGSVIDFLDFHFRGRHWPAFNIADSAICVGVILLMLWNFRNGRRQMSKES